MQVAVVQDEPVLEPSWADRFDYFLRSRGVRVLRIAAPDPGAVASITGTDGLLWRFIHTPESQGVAKPILSALEHGLGLRVWPNAATRWHYDDKIGQFRLLHAIGAPIPATHAFYDKEMALAWARSTAYPVVFKLAGGASSQSVCLVDSVNAATRLIERAFSRGLSSMHNLDRIASGHTEVPWRRLRALLRDLSREAAHSLRYGRSHLFEPRMPMRWPLEFHRVLFQEFLADNAFDYRITVIGRRAFGFRRFNRPNDFRASGSGLIDFDPAQVDLEAVRIAHDVSARCGFQSMAYDFLRAPDSSLRIVEISYTFVGTAVLECPGYWDRELRWHEGQTWPHDAIAEDFLASLRPKAGEGG